MTTTLPQASNDPVRDDVLESRALSHFVRSVGRKQFVLVGDHQPERRINHDPCAVDPALTVERCGLKACAMHNRCCNR